MKITKFPQSCIIIESSETKILIDPSTVEYEESFFPVWQNVDAVLVTHRHSDHINSEVLQKLNVPIYSTSEVQFHFPNLKINIIKENDILKFGDINVKVVHAIHGYVALAGEVKENIGFIIDNTKTQLYYTSDTIRFKNDYKANVLFANITAFDASMNLWGAVQTLKETGANLLVVLHQDVGKMIYPKQFIQSYLKEQNINYIIPETLESFNI